VDSGNRIASCKRGDKRLLDKNFKSKSIKKRGKILISITSTSNNSNNISYQTTTYMTTSTSPNPYVIRRLNNMNKAIMMKKERDDWTKMYHKTLKGLETMIDEQRQVKDMMKIAVETNMMITEMEDTILKASINNWVINATNITGVSEDLRYLIQSDMENQVFQIQQILADELDKYKGKENAYVDENIREIQDLFKDEEIKKDKGRIEDKEVILVKPYKVSQSSTSSTTSFIMDKVKNLIKYMKFIKSPTQTRLFQPPPHYQSLKSRGEQNLKFWKEVTMALVDQKHNTEMGRNSYPIVMFQGGPPHEPYFIAINNRGQVIIGPSKKIVAMHMVGELEVLI